MKVTVYLSDGGQLKFEGFDADSALDLREEFTATRRSALTFDMDGDTVLVNRDHVVRIDFDHTEA